MAAIAINSAPTAIATQPDVQHRLSLVAILTALAEARQASVSAETLKLYAAKLSQFDLMDVREAVGRIAMEPRREGETAFPDLGGIVSRTRAVKASRAAIKLQDYLKRKDAEAFWGWIDRRVSDGLTQEQALADGYRRAPWMRGVGRP